MKCIEIVYLRVTYPISLKAKLSLNTPWMHMWGVELQLWFTPILGITGRWVANLTTCRLTLVSINKRLGGLQRRSGRFRGETFPHAGTRTPYCPAYWLPYLGSCHRKYWHTSTCHFKAQNFRL